MCFTHPLFVFSKYESSRLVKKRQQFSILDIDKVSRSYLLKKLLGMITLYITIKKLSSCKLELRMLRTHQLHIVICYVTVELLRET